MSEKEQIPEVPKPDAKDHLHKLGKVAADIAGQAIGKMSESPIDAPVAALYDMVFRVPIDSRRDAFLESIRAKLIEVLGDVEELRSEKFWTRPQLTSALVATLPIALKTHQQQKLDALRNAVVNSILLESMSDDMKSTVYSLLDRVTATHIFVLRHAVAADGPSKWRKGCRSFTLTDGCSVKDFDEIFPEFEGQRRLFYLAIHDLLELGLIRPKPLDLPLKGFRLQAKYDMATGTMNTPTWEENALEEFLKRLHLDELARKGGLVNLWDTEMSAIGEMLLDLVEEPAARSEDA